MYLGNDNAMLPIFTAAVGVPASASPAKVYVSYHAPSTATQRRDINRFDDATNLTTNTLGGSVTTANLAVYDLCGGPSPDPQRCLGSEPDSRQPHTTPSYLASSKRGLRQLRVAWNGSGAAITNNLPVGSRDIHGFAALTMRVTLNYADSRNLLGQAGDFHLVLEDGTGTKATVSASSYATVLRYPPGNQVSGSTTPKIVLNTLRIALTAFTGVDMTDIRKVSLVFDVKLSGALLISDLTLTQPVPPVLTSSRLSG